MDRNSTRDGPNSVRFKSSSKTGGRTPKLKDSCNACGRSKVKCTKEKPACHRCALRGWVCEYGASNRAGRFPSRAHINTDTWTRRRSDTAAVTPHEDLRKESLVSPRTAWTVQDFGEFQDQDSMFENVETWYRPGSSDVSTSNSMSGTLQYVMDEGGFDDVFPLAMEHPGSYDRASDMFSPHTMLHSSNSFSTTRGSYDQMNSYSSGSMSDFIPMSNVNAHGPIDHHINEYEYSRPSTPSQVPSADCCLSNALAVLPQLLVQTSRSCPSASHQQTPRPGSIGMDSVISRNKEVIQTVIEILECTCSHDDYLASILTMIVFKVLALYASISVELTPARKESSDSGSRSNSHLRHHSTHEASEQIYAQGTVQNLDGSTEHVFAQATAHPSGRMTQQVFGHVDGPGGMTKQVYTQATVQNPSGLTERVYAEATADGMGEPNLAQATVTGSYDMFNSDASRTWAQDVLEDLTQVQRVVNLLTKRLRDIRQRFPDGGGTDRVKNEASNGVKPISEAGTMALSAVMVNQLEVELQGRLVDVTGEVIKSLRRWSGADRLRLTTSTNNLAYA